MRIFNKKLILNLLQQQTPSLLKFFTASKNKSFLFALLFVCLALTLNFMFLSLSTKASYDRPFLSLELVLVFVFLLFRFNFLASLLFVFGIANELILALSAKLQLVTLEQIMAISSFVFYINRRYLFYIFLYLVLVTLIFVVLIYAAKKISFKQKVGVIFTVLLVPFVISPTFFLLIFKYHSFKDSINSLLITNYQALNFKQHDTTIEYLDLTHPSAFELTIKDQVYSSSQKPAKILYITVESWGYPYDKNILHQQVKPLLDNLRLTILKFDKIYAENTTIAGELRELCGKRSSYLSNIFTGYIKSLNIIGEKNKGICLPQYLKNNGYTTVGVHAANGKMYDRNNLYKSFGFAYRFFDGNMPVNIKNRCKSWPGYCDLDLMPFVQNNLLANDTILLYWMTLNSHIPYDKEDVRGFNQGVCDKNLPTGYSNQLCNYHQLHIQFFKGLNEMLKNPNLKGLQVVISGDHKPIFMDGENNAKSDNLFIDNTVPYLYFTLD